jgi:tRNA threonylcarbamoyladenosine biosynthesis protein TsaB
MLVLTIRTDKPEAEVGLYDGENPLAYETWQAHRQLSETLHHRIASLLSTQDKKLSDLEGVVCYKGPGSFTGLRIGLTVANALAYSLQIPVLSTHGEGWQLVGVSCLHDGDNEQVALPEYGAPVFITQQKK